MLPLQDIVAVSLEQAVAAPFASRQLADFGARVIKVERPGKGDFGRGYDTAVMGMACQFVWLNRSKESLTLDLKHPDAGRILRRLLERTDVFLQNLAPGAAERLGFGTDILRRDYPRLIICNISGYGTSGPYRDRKAYDLLIQSETGLVSLTGTPETPCRVGISIADIATGMYAFVGILTALRVRDRTGQGAALEVSMFEALGEWVSYAGYYTCYGGKAPERTGPHHATVAPYGPFSACDGIEVCLGLANDREWTRFCEIVLEKPEIAQDLRFASIPHRVENRDALHSVINEVFAGLSSVEVIGRLKRAQVGYARLNTMREFMTHPQLASRNRWRTVDSPAGPLEMLIPPVTLEGAEPIMGPIPDVGEHTEAILCEFDFAADEIARFRTTGAI